MSQSQEDSKSLDDAVKAAQKLASSTNTGIGGTGNNSAATSSANPWANYCQ